jgi:hypothetical protein
MSQHDARSDAPRAGQGVQAKRLGLGDCEVQFLGSPVALAFATVEVSGAPTFAYASIGLLGAGDFEVKIFNTFASASQDDTFSILAPDRSRGFWRRDADGGDPPLLEYAHRGSFGTGPIVLRDRPSLIRRVARAVDAARGSKKPRSRQTEGPQDRHLARAISGGCVASDRARRSGVAAI